MMTHPKFVTLHDDRSIFDNNFHDFDIDNINTFVCIDDTKVLILSMSQS